MPKRPALHVPSSCHLLNPSAAERSDDSASTCRLGLNALSRRLKHPPSLSSQARSPLSEQFPPSPITAATRHRRLPSTPCTAQLLRAPRLQTHLCQALALRCDTFCKRPPLHSRALSEEVRKSICYRAQPVLGWCAGICMACNCLCMLCLVSSILCILHVAAFIALEAWHCCQTSC